MPSDSHPDTREERNALEWAVFGLGLILVVGVLGFLVYQLVAGSDEPANLVVTFDTPEERRGTVLIPLTVTNEGDQVAEAAVIEVCAGPDACGEVTFTYVPQGSTRQGVVGLTAPLAAPLTSRIVSYRTR